METVTGDDGADDGDGSSELSWLTLEEQTVVQDLGWLYQRLCEIAGHDGTREDDLREIRFHIHALQRVVMAQAAARLYPVKFRLIGSTISKKKEGEVQ